MPIYPTNRDPLFSEFSLADLIKAQVSRMREIVNSYTDDAFLEIPAADFIQAVFDTGNLPALVLSREGQRHNPREINTVLLPGRPPMRVQAYVHQIDFPYTGASGLFRHFPDRRDLRAPIAKLNSGAYEGTISIEVIATDDVDGMQVKNAIDEELNAAFRYIHHQSLQLEPYNSSLLQLATEMVEERRNRILRIRQISESLGYPLVRRPGAPLTYTSPVVRKQLTVRSISQPGYTPEPTIEEADYKAILNIIEMMTFVMERSPSVFSQMPEEVLRDHYLVQLNGQYGNATGETFNGAGKTDILVSDKGRNIFIAECKIWHGPKSVTEALDQLLSYLTWRDTKAALIFFNRNKGFTKMLEALWEAVPAHPNYKRGPIDEGSSRKRYTFASTDDPNREIHLTVMAFDTPTTPI
jgi:hypothetical protein